MSPKFPAAALLLLFIAAAIDRSPVFAANCDTPLNVTLRAPMVGDLVARIQNKVRGIVTKDTEGRLYYPLVAGFVRLSFHACAARRCSSYVDLEDEANNGLTQVVNILDDLWNSLQRDPNWRGFSKADLYALAGVAAFELATGLRKSLIFRYGRADLCTDEAVSEHGVRIPSRALGTQGTFKYFSEMFGFDENETVAIMGAHSLGVVHDVGTLRPVARWTDGDPGKLSNEYYSNLLRDSWRMVPGNYTGAPHVMREWRLPNINSRLMLNCDIGLVKNIDVYNHLTGAAACSVYRACKRTSAAGTVEAYAHDSEYFLDNFAQAFGKMLENGWGEQLIEVFE